MPVNQDRLTSSRLARALAAAGAEPGPLRVVDTVASTNDEARRWAPACSGDWALVVAEAQTAGRGRRGRTWASPSGLNLYLSLVSPEVAEARQWPRLPILAAVAVADALADTGAGVGLKWPNDLLAASGRKVGGILVETTGGSDPRGLVGIGLNVRAGANALPAGATSLALEAPGDWDRPSLAAALVASFQGWWRRWGEQGFEPVVTAWSYHALWLGRPVRVCGEAGDLTGRLLGIDPWGRLRLETPQGEYRLAAGEVSLRWVE